MSHMVCRIGHYDDNRYESTSRAMKSKLTEPKVKWPSGRIWHSFTVYPPFRITLKDKTIDPRFYFVEFPEGKWWVASRTFKPDDWMPEYIAKWGWRMIPDKEGYSGGGLRLKRRAPKGHPKDIRKITAST